MTVLRTIFVGLLLVLAFGSFANERYCFVRSYKVDGRDVTLADGEANLDLAKIYPDDFCRGGEGQRWAIVEACVESDVEKTVRLYYRNEWFGELSVNGVCIKKKILGPSDVMASVDIKLRKGSNRIALRTRAGRCGWYCAFAFDGEKTQDGADAVVDFTHTAGGVRPLLHASGFGPLICSCPQSVIDDVMSMNLAAARTHDWALINPGERVCDYYHVFPLMNLDATKPEHYHFGPTDYLLKRTREEMGMEVFYRLGATIEHSGDKVHFNTLIPVDFEKVAEVFAATVRHYNRGWANGYHWDIKYWEIWNEPDGVNNMWCLPEGDSDSDAKISNEKAARRRSLFIRFFVTCLKRLKSEFSDIKVGGPALTGMDESYFVDLLSACREAGVAPDFISWHYYGNGVNEILGAVERARKMCDDHGFVNCGLVLDEWHYMGCSFQDLRSVDPVVQGRVWNGPSSHNGTDAAAFTLSVLARFQASALDQAYYYGCRHKGAWGYKDELSHFYKTYYALKAFGLIVRKYPVLGEVKTTDSITTLVAKSEDGARAVLLVAEYRGLPGDIVLNVKGLPSGVPKARVIDQTRNLETVEVHCDGARIVLPKLDRESASYIVEFE